MIFDSERVAVARPFAHFRLPGGRNKNIQGLSGFNPLARHWMPVFQKHRSESRRTSRMIAAAPRTIQIPLIHIVESDDLYLEAQEDVFWFGLLRDLDWRSLCSIAARYSEIRR